VRYALLSVLLLAGCASAPSGPAGRYGAEDSVYVALLEHMLGGNQGPPVTFLLLDSTAALRWAADDPFGPRLFERFTSTLPPELVESLWAAARERAPINPEIVRRLAPRVRSFRYSREPGSDGPEGHYREADGREVALGLGEHETYRLADGTPAITHIFSRVGFDSGRRRAVLYHSGVCGPRCGGSRLVLLERDERGRWRYSRSGDGAIY
jgi:hypothetical protein